MIRRLRSDDGSVTVFTVVLFTGLMMFAGLVADGGAALTAKIRALHESSEAARAGAQRLDVAEYHRHGVRALDRTAATAAAQAYLAGTGDTGTVTVTADSVNVHVTARHATWLLTLVGIGTLAVTATSTATPEPATP